MLDNVLPKLHNAPKIADKDPKSGYMAVQSDAGALEVLAHYTGICSCVPHD